MIDEFKSIEELYERVKPALRVKISEAKKRNINNIKELDVWNYLIDNKWKTGNNLMLSDIVDDILNVDLNDIEIFIKNKSQSFDEDI